MIKFSGKDRHLGLFPTSLKIEDLKTKSIIDFPSSVYAGNGVIPGLYVYDEFITEGIF